MTTPIKMSTTIQTDKKFRLELTGSTIANMLRAQGHDIPDGASVSFHVPGGGDYSHMDIDVDAENPVCVEWKSSTTKTEEP